MAQYALRVKPRGLIANDAGGCPDNSGMEVSSLYSQHIGHAILVVGVQHCNPPAPGNGPTKI